MTPDALEACLFGSVFMHRIPPFLISRSPYVKTEKKSWALSERQNLRLQQVILLRLIILSMSVKRVLVTARPTMWFKLKTFRPKLANCYQLGTDVFRNFFI